MNGLSSLVSRMIRKNSVLGIALGLLSRRDRKLVLVLVIVQVFLGFLDLVGVALVGLMSSLAVTGISGKQTGERVSKILQLLNLETQESRIQFASLGLLAALFLACKTMATMFLGRKILFFLSSRSASVSGDLLKKYFSLPITFLRRRNTQEAIYALTAGVNYLTLGVIGSWASLISDTTLMFVMGFGLFLIDPVMTLCILGLFISLAVILYRLTHKKVDRLGVRQAELAIDSNRHISETIATYRELLVRDRRSHYANLIASMRFHQARGAAELSFLSTVAKYVIELAVVVSAILIAGFEFATQPPSRATAVVAIFLMASARISPAILRIQQGLVGIRTGAASATPTLQLIEEVRREVTLEEPKDSLFTRDHFGFKANTEVRALKFTYPGSDRRTIKGINFSIAENSFIGIVGNSGSGKSTLLDLIIGVLSPDEGEIKISGLPAEQCLKKWPGAISYIPQHIAIFDGTLKSNIELGYSSGTISDELCWSLLQIACLEDDVLQLEDGLNSQLGEGGFRLSGGQRQRLGIARALVTNPDLIVLDEATSALDGATEQKVMERLLHEEKKRTIIAVAHRLSTIRTADHILVLDSGRIVDQGNFSELRQRNEQFRFQAELAGL